jgi:uncharacterized protein (TIGR02246 family)
MPQDLTDRIFNIVDAAQPDAIAELFTPDARFVFGNAEPLVGRDAIAAGLAVFFTKIVGLHHEILNLWRVGPDTIAETEVTYRRHDGRSVVVPVVSIWSADADDVITDYRVFGDLAPVFTP